MFSTFLKAYAVQGLNLAAVNAEIDRRGFVPVNEKMQVLDKSGKPLSSVYCIGDANGMFRRPSFKEADVAMYISLF